MIPSSMMSFLADRLLPQLQLTDDRPELIIGSPVSNIDTSL